MCGAPDAPTHAEAPAYTQEAHPSALAQTTDTRTPNPTSDEATSTTASSASALPMDGYQ